MNKERLISRYNWFQRTMTYPAPNWDMTTKMDFYYEFVAFIDAVELCGYKFVHHSERENDKYLSVATDVVPIEKVGA